MSDKHLNFCKDCTKKRIDEHRQLNIERIREYDRSRNNLPLRKAARIAYSIRYDKKKKRASVTINNMLRGNKTLKKPCVICGNEKSEGHHYDYNKPTEVIWLCTEHHRRLHANRFSLIPKTLNTP